VTKFVKMVTVSILELKRMSSRKESQSYFMLLGYNPMRKFPPERISPLRWFF
jgi:hypothetical protein